MGLETLLLVGGGVFVWWLRTDRWTLKASVKSSLGLARRFQVAVELLGLAPSHEFPNRLFGEPAKTLKLHRMLHIKAPSQEALLGALKEEIASLIERMKHRTHRLHHQESLAATASIAAIVAVMSV